MLYVDPTGSGGTPGPDLNQHGLTGSWFEPTSSGQGVQVEVFPNRSTGTRSVFVGWFTFDTVVGGAERQRWYTALGQVVTGQPNASMTIYQNTGGNFSAPPATDAEPVGIATLSFDTCSSGQLAYTLSYFPDGSVRTGDIPLTRLTQNVTCSTTTANFTNADFALPGTGTTPQRRARDWRSSQPEFQAFFAAWYTYAPTARRWSSRTTLVHRASPLCPAPVRSRCQSTKPPVECSTDRRLLGKPVY